MKPIKVSFAVLVASMAMAFVGASPALAESTQLCNEDLFGCNPITHTHETTISGAKAKILTSALNVECDVLFLGDAGALGAPQIIEGHYTYTNCGSCTVTEASLAGSTLKFLKLGHETADVAANEEIHLKCGSFIDCYYNGENLLGTAKGWWLSAGAYSNGEVKFSGQELHKVLGTLCPSKASLDMTTTPLSRMFIGS